MKQQLFQPNQKGVLAILCVFLMLAGASIDDMLSNIISIFSISIIPTDSTGVGSYAELLSYFLLNGSLGGGCLFVVYAWYTKKQWAKHVAVIVASVYGVMHGITGFMVLLGALINPEGVAGALPALLVLGIYFISYAVAMIYLIHYIRKPEITAWFSNIEPEEQNESQPL